VIYFFLANIFFDNCAVPVLRLIDRNVAIACDDIVETSGRPRVFDDYEVTTAKKLVRSDCDLIDSETSTTIRYNDCAVIEIPH